MTDKGITIMAIVIAEEPHVNGGAVHRWDILKDEHIEESPEQRVALDIVFQRTPLGGPIGHAGSSLA